MWAQRMPGRGSKCKGPETDWAWCVGGTGPEQQKLRASSVGEPQGKMWGAHEAPGEKLRLDSRKPLPGCSAAVTLTTV